jgi:hypothetical protein
MAMDSQTLEEFKNRLAQTIWWCTQRALSADPDLLRTPELRPFLLEESRASAMNTVASARVVLGGLEIRNATIPPNLGDGRLLVYFPNHDLFCGAAEQESDGFFDVHNVPPWDTWVCYLEGQKNVDYYDTEFLIAGIPPEFLHLANSGIEVNPEQCILWLSDTPLELAELLRAHDLLV